MNQHLQKRSLFLIIVLISFCLSLTSLAAAGGIKERMKARVPAINGLKATGIVGETNKGFLEFRQNQASQQQLIDDENADRRKVYQAIAKQQGTDANLVGSRRAKQIAAKAKPGTWLQDEGGSWYQK